MIPFNINIRHYVNKQAVNSVNRNKQRGINPELIQLAVIILDLVSPCLWLMFSCLVLIGQTTAAA